MLIVCWSVKGGSGATVVAAALSVLLAASRPDGALAVDVPGDLAAALGVVPPTPAGLGDWLAADASVGPQALARLAMPAGGGLELIARGCDPDVHSPRWTAAAEMFAAQARAVVVDAGTGAPPAALTDSADQSILVVRPCYLALRRATELTSRVTGIVLVDEPGRALGRRDVESVTGVKVIAEVPVDPAIARAVDAGLLACRLPSTLGRALRNVA